MWSPNPKVWSPKIENVESQILRSRSVMMTIDASPTFRSKGHGRCLYNWTEHCPPINSEWEGQWGTRKFNLSHFSYT